MCGTYFLGDGILGLKLDLSAKILGVWFAQHLRMTTCRFVGSVGNSVPRDTSLSIFVEDYDNSRVVSGGVLQYLKYVSLLKSLCLSPSPDPSR